MHIKFPSKVDNVLRYLKFKFLPKTLFFRTMLLIFIPLIVVQVVSIVAFFDGSWGRVGKRLSSNLTSDMSFLMELTEKSTRNFADVKALAAKNFDLDYSYFSNKQKYNVMNKASKNNRLVTGFLEESLRSKFPDAVINIYIGIILINWITNKRT